jgi:hypothetical protein
MSLANLARFASPGNIPNSNMEIDMMTLDKWTFIDDGDQPKQWR